MEILIIVESALVPIALYVIFKKTLNKNCSKIMLLYPIINTIIVSILCFINPQLFNIFSFFSLLVAYFVIPVFAIRDMKFKQILFLSLSIIGLFTALYGVADYILHIFDLTTYNNILRLIILILLTLFILVFSEKPYLKRFFTNMINMPRRTKILFTISIYILINFLSALVVCMETFPNTKIIKFTGVSFLIILVIWLFVLYQLITNYLKIKYYEKLNASLQNCFNQQKIQYETMIKSNESIRRFRHDFLNLKIGLNTYLNNNDVDGAIEYLNGCDKSIKSNDIIFKTGNTFLNALLSEKATFCKDKKIRINFYGLFNYEAINPTDLCIIFGNALDNAIEACMKIDNDELKNIDIYSKVNHGHIFITITNPTKENIKVINNSISTSKTDKDIHGIGLYSIKKVLGKYNGNINLSCENKIFKTVIGFQC